MTDIRKTLANLGENVRERFEAQKRVLSFHEYLEMFREHPWRHTRDSARYLRDCFQHYGTYEVQRPWGPVTRWRLFDLPFDEPREGHARRRSDHLVGHESVQWNVYRTLENFVREGRANRLVLLHGPNGSAKSTFTSCIMRALEDYSAKHEGALYRFSWIFPRGQDGKGIGFGSTERYAPRAGESYAHLPEERIEVKIKSELREHPLLLLPLAERRQLLQSTYSESGIDESPPDWIWNGQLSQKNRQIFEALLTAYRGDIDRVLAHVQVERYYVSRRYRVGAVTIGPQMHVDAHERQITADHSLNALPASLSALTLFEPYGELVDASGGMVEFSDLLKRPLDAWKYLLLAIETGEVSLPLSNLQLNATLVGTSNEMHLSAFREHPEYNSFRARLQQVRVPFLLNYSDEQDIYEAQIVPQVRRHVAPHAIYVAALWAVLTRLNRANPERYSNPQLGRIAADLTPLEKAELYAQGHIPPRLSADDAKELRNGIQEIYEESGSTAEYEGLNGASPREIRIILLDAAHDGAHDCLSPLAVLENIAAFVQRGDYEFLQQSPERGYHDHRGFLGVVRNKWLDRVDDELRTCTGMVEETQYAELFDKYVNHVSNWLKNEQLYNRVTEQYENPDTEFMESIEEMLDVEEDPEEFRRNLISSVAAHAIDHPGTQVDYARAFPRHIERIKDSYFRERRKQIAIIARDVLSVLDEESLEEERQQQAENTLQSMKSRFGYEDSSIRVALGELMRERYA
jgi:predicted Ser/Thr protein kinase